MGLTGSVSASASRAVWSASAADVVTVDGDSADLLARYRSIAESASRLAGSTGIERLMPMVLGELCRCGFTRAWLAALDECALTVTDVHHRGHVKRPGATAPLTPGSYEAEVIRRRSTVRATDPLRIDPVVSEAVGSHSYVAAPLAIDTRVIGILGADRPAGPLPVTSQDREVIGAFARLASQSVHRILLAAQLQRVQDDVRELTARLNGRVDERCEEVLTLARLAEADGRDAHTTRQASLVGSGRIHELLTPRELEVLRLMAAGETNGAIAAQLVVSLGTVKSHVKSILRKLHASNRATAVARFYKLTRP